MSDISLLVNGALTGNPASLTEQLPSQFPMQSDSVGQNSTPDPSSTLLHTDIRPPEFLQVDSSIVFASPVIHQKYQNQLSAAEIRQQIEATPKQTDIITNNQRDFSVYTPFHLDPEEYDIQIEFSPHPVLTPPSQNVSSLEDLQPSGLGFDALPSIKKCYTYVDDPENQLITDDEYMAGLETCLQQVEELLTHNIDHTIEPEDLILLRRLQNEVKAELAQLQSSVSDR
jgi:hypothetical protein